MVQKTIVPDTMEGTTDAWWWSAFYLQTFGIVKKIPSFPELRVETQEAFQNGKLGRWAFLYVCPEIEQRLPSEERVSSHGLAGSHRQLELPAFKSGWIAIETISPPSSWNDPNGYGGGTDPLARHLFRRGDRMGHSAEVLKDTLLSASFALCRKDFHVQLPQAREFAVIAAMFRRLRANYGFLLPELGGSVREWCADRVHTPTGQLKFGGESNRKVVSESMPWVDDPANGFRIKVDLV